MGLNYANLFVGYVEEQIFSQFDDPNPELFGRYIGDCLGATSCTKKELERFIHIPQAKNIPYQSFLIKLVFGLLAHAENTFFFQN